MNFEQPISVLLFVASRLACSLSPPPPAMVKAGKKKSAVHKYVVTKGVDAENKTTWQCGSDGCEYTKIGKQFQATKWVEHLMTCFKNQRPTPRHLPRRPPQPLSVRQQYRLGWQLLLLVLMLLQPLGTCQLKAVVVLASILGVHGQNVRSPMMLTPAFTTAVLAAGSHSMVCVVSSEEQLMVAFLSSGAQRDATTPLE